MPDSRGGNGGLLLLGAAAAVAAFALWRSHKPARPLPLNDDWQKGSAKEKAKRAEIFAKVEARKKEEKSTTEKRGVDRVNNYNIAVTGVSGSGKSSLVNAFRGTHDSDKAHAAQVGEDETTMEARGYPDPRNQHMVYWDIPGAGTEAHPIAGYFERQELFLFDTLIIVVQRAIREVDLQLARQALDCNVPVRFVRSRSDEAAHNIGKSTRCSETKAVEQLRAVAKNQEQQLKTKGFPNQQVFLVCADRMRDFVNGCHEGLLDEAELMEALARMVMSRRGGDPV